MKRRYAIIAALAVVILAAAWLLFSRILPQNTDPSANPRPVTLYEIEVQAANTGWTFDLHRRAGGWYTTAGDIDSAIAHWEAAVNLQPDHLDTLRQLADLYTQQQTWAKAVDILRQIVALRPNETRSSFQLAALLSTTDPRSALPALRTAARTATYGDVAAALIEVLEASPPDAAMRVGLVLAEYGYWAEAEVAFRYAALWEAPYAEALAYTGLAQDRQGKQTSASWIAAALAAEPENAQVWYLNGLHLRENFDYVASLEALVRAQSLDPTNPALQAELGTAYRRVGDLVQAESWLQQAVRSANNAPEFTDLLAIFYAEEATNLTQLGIDPAPQIAQAADNPDVMASHGYTLYTGGEEAAGLAEIEAALELDPENARALFYRATIALNDEDVATAVPMLRQVALGTSEFALEAQRILENLDY